MAASLAACKEKSCLLAKTVLFVHGGMALWGFCFGWAFFSFDACVWCVSLSSARAPGKPRPRGYSADEVETWPKGLLLP